MASLAEMSTLASATEGITTVAMNDIVVLWSSVHDADPAVIRDTLLDVIPGVTREYSALNAELATQWYADLDPASSFTPTPAPPPPAPAIEATVRWSVGPLFGVGNDTVISLLAGGVQRHIANTGRATLLDNVGREKGARWARHANANACGWCRMLATREPSYRSKAKALSSHDYCKCDANVVRPGGVYERPKYVDQWERDYQDARKEVGGGTNDIVNYLRRNGART